MAQGFDQESVGGGLSAGPGLEVPGFRGCGDDALGAPLEKLQMPWALTSPPRSKLSVWDGGTRIAGPHTS